MTEADSASGGGTTDRNTGGGDVTTIAAGVYGTVIVASVLAAAQLQTLRSVIALVFVTLLVYWLSEAYSETLAHSLAGHRPKPGEFVAALHHRRTMLQASYLPVAVLVVCYLLGFSTANAIAIAIGVCCVILFTLGWQGGRRRGLHLRGCLISSSIAGSFGLALVVLKLLVK